jgi:hypothetical protein
MYFSSGSSRLPKSANTKRLILYSMYSFGVPALMTILVFILNQVDNSTDPLSGNENGTISARWRPGFGEETCWFTSCSDGFVIFLYG